MNAKRKASKSPWGLSPMCATERARRKWDWQGSSELLAKVNEARRAAGLPPIVWGKS